MASSFDPLGLLSPPYNEDFDLPKGSADADNPYDTLPLSPWSPWDADDPSSDPVKSPAQMVGPIDPAIRGFTRRPDNSISLIDDSLLPPELAGHQAADNSLSLPAEQTADDSMASCGITPIKSPEKRRDSGLGSSSDDSLSYRGTPKGQQMKKNRLAASKCRLKKKREHEELKARSQLLESQQVQLKATAAALQSEVLNLKNEILEHGLCSDCEPIQKYISESANRITYSR